MLRISKLTDYAVVLLSKMAKDQGQLTVPQLHGQTNLPIPTISKVLKKLARAGLLATTRGAAGGYRLARPAPEINIVEIIEAMDGPIAMTDCVGGAHKRCAYLEKCHLQPNWSRVNHVIRESLQAMRLSDLDTSQNGQHCEAA
ncbi:MAG: SUF system Fe-S cluster assembly regulator, partial [Alphaproteobacteria bacterium]|nr:SUF system Fe-S cluster assembly regulator [Alphaproteobacteria bacterium]